VVDDLAARRLRFRIEAQRLEQPLHDLDVLLGPLASTLPISVSSIW